MNNAHEREPAIITQSIAALRFPGYKITGAGPIAVVLSCSNRVVLTAWPMEAETIRAERCGQHCNHIIAPEGLWHTIKTIAAPRTEQLQPTAHWNR